LETVEIGPLVSASHCRRVRSAVERAAADLGPPIYPLGQQPPRCDAFADSWFPAAVIVSEDPAHDIVQEETFGPILVVQPAIGWDHAVTLCNGVRQGLAASIFTQSRALIDVFLDHAQAGILKINRSTADAEIDVPFGGWKASGIGPPEHGVFDLEYYTRPQTIYGLSSESR
jgi:acyl-CoA reductase-like NAD-dependent aldehyde dehydrogenase